MAALLVLQTCPHSSCLAVCLQLPAPVPSDVPVPQQLRSIPHPVPKCYRQAAAAADWDRPCKPTTDDQLVPVHKRW